MNFLSREMEIFLSEIGQAATWQDWLKVRPKYENDRETGVQILIAKLDSGFLANLFPQFPYDNVEALRRFCAEKASSEDLNTLFIIGENAKDFWLNYKATAEIRSLVQGAIRETKAIWNERPGNRISDQERIFGFITGGVRLFFDPQGSARPIKTRLELLEFLDQFNDYYSAMVTSGKLVELKFLDRKIGQTEYFTGNAENRTLKAYKNQVMLQIARSDPNYMETIQPEIPYKQLDAFKAYCTHADSSTLENLFRLATEDDGFWINHKASEQIRTYLKDALKQSAAIEGERHFKSDLAGVFAFVVGGLRLFSHERPYFRERISFSDYLAFLTEHTEYFADRWAKAECAEIRFLDSAIGNTGFFTSLRKDAPFLQYLRHVQMCLSREDPSFMENIYPEFPHQNLADFKNYVREKTSYEDLMKLYEVVMEAESFWLNFKAHADIKSYLAESIRLTEAIFSERKEVMVSEQKNIFAFVVGGIRFFQSAANQRILLYSKDDLIHFLFENRAYFRRRSEESSHTELEFLDAEIGNLHFFKQQMPSHQKTAPFRFENYYNALIDKPIDLAKQVELKIIRNGAEVPVRQLSLNGQEYHIDLGRVVLDEGHNTKFMCRLSLREDQEHLPLIFGASGSSKIVEADIYAQPDRQSSQITCQLGNLEVKIICNWESAFFRLKKTEFEIGKVQRPADWDQKFSIELEFESKNIDLKSLNIESPYLRDTDLVYAGVHRIVANVLLHKSQILEKQNEVSIQGLSWSPVHDDSGWKNGNPAAPKANLAIPATLKCEGCETPLKLTLKKDYPILQVGEKSEGNYRCETDNGIEATFDIEIDGKSQTVTSAKQDLKISRSGVHDLKILQDSAVVFEKTGIYKHYFAQQKSRRILRWLVAIAGLACIVFALRTEFAFLAAFHSENRIATKIVALANIGKNAEYLTTVFRSGSTTDRQRAIQFARREGTYSPELFAEFSNYLSNKDAEPTEILNLFATKSKHGPVISIPDVGVAYKGRIWRNCTFGNHGTACAGTPTFATWPIAAAKCRELRTRGLQWDLPSTAQLDEITENTEQVFDFHRLNTGDQIYWSNDQLKNEGKVKVVDFSKKMVFRAPLQNEYVFRCVGSITEKK